MALYRHQPDKLRKGETMADKEHIAILTQGVKTWNAWRKKNPAIVPQLGAVLLHGLDLSGADLSGADLSGANLSGANLSGADLRLAYLIKADLSKANLSGADLSGACLSRADFKDAYLEDANLKETDLTYTNLKSAYLTGANLLGAWCGFGTLGNVDLSKVKGLDTISHEGPSTIGIDTIYRSGGNIPENFLRGAGVPEIFITFMKSLTAQVFDFYSCFISHSSKDREFASRLYTDLQSNGVRCWYAPHDRQIGASILTEIDNAIRLHDKLLVILSENSIHSGWVQHEILSAIEKEREIRTVYPIRLDDAIMDSNIPWAKLLKDTRHIADFTGWKDHDTYIVAFDRLLRDLKAKS